MFGFLIVCVDVGMKFVKDFGIVKMMGKWSNGGEYDWIRGYIGRDFLKYDNKYLIDFRFVVEMNFKGKGKSGINVVGWERNVKKFFNMLFKSNFEFWSVENIVKIKRGRVLVVDE